MPSSQTGARHVEVQARLIFRGYSGNFETQAADLGSVSPELEYVAKLDESGREEFLRYADMHHVSVRVLRVLRSAAEGRIELRPPRLVRSGAQKRNAPHRACAFVSVAYLRRSRSRGLQDHGDQVSRPLAGFGF